MADHLRVCRPRLECPFDTAVELAAFSLQGEHAGRIPLPAGLSSRSWNCFLGRLYVEWRLLVKWRRDPRLGPAPSGRRLQSVRSEAVGALTRPWATDHRSVSGKRAVEDVIVLDAGPQFSDFSCWSRCF